MKINGAFATIKPGLRASCRSESGSLLYAIQIMAAQVHNNATIAPTDNIINNPSNLPLRNDFRRPKRDNNGNLSAAKSEVILLPSAQLNNDLMKIYGARGIPTNERSLYYTAFGIRRHRIIKEGS